MASTYISRTNGTSTNSQKMTYSGWFKIGTQSVQQELISTKSGGSAYTQVLIMAATTHENVFRFDATSVEGNGIGIKLNRSLRDPGAWYHVVIGIDTTQSVASDRLKLYINGVQETSFATSTYPIEDDTLDLTTSGIEVQVGAYNNTEHWTGSMSHVNLIDGLQYAASDFGSFDATSGIWKLKTAPSVTYGNNGFFLKMEDRTNLDLDSSSNAFTFTTTGTLTATYDNPDNNFATLNPIYPTNGFSNQSAVFSNGNNTLTTVNASSQWGISPSTMEVSTGKWYAECKVSATSGYTLVGLLSSNWTADNFLGYFATDYGWYSSDGKVYNNNNSGVTASLNTYGASNIIGIYLDLDNNKLYYGKDGVIENSGTGITITAPDSTHKLAYLMAAQEWNSGGNGTFQWNFGNGYFGTTAVTSGVADAGGEGTFEYNPSSGTFDGSSKDFRAICTNNLATYG